jgi:hypothetical protein
LKYLNKFSDILKRFLASFAFEIFFVFGDTLFISTRTQSDAVWNRSVKSEMQCECYVTNWSVILTVHRSLLY